MGEETDGVVESISKMQSKIKALSGVNILTDAGEYKDTYTILYEIGQVWEEMSDIDQAALLELMAGKNRANTLSAILSNMTDLEGAYESALKAEGSALKENEAYLDSIQGRIDLFTNALQTLWMNFINDDVVKFVVDLGTELLKVVDNIGVLNVAVIGLSSYLYVHSKGKTIFGLIVDGLTAIKNSDLFVNIGLGLSQFVENFKNAGSAAQGSVGILQKLKSGFAGLTSFISPTTLAVTGFAVALTAVIALYNHFGPTHSRFTRELEEGTEQLTEVKNKLESLNQELSTTKSRIDELETKGVLSFTEEEELARLKAQNDELERSIKLEEAREKRAQGKQISAALGAAKTDQNLQNHIIRTDYDSYSSATGEFVTSASAGNAWEQNLTALEDAKKDLDEANKKLWDAEASGMDTTSDEFKKLEKNVKKAEEKVSSINATIDSLETNWQDTYGDVEYIENATTEQEKAWNELYKQHENYINKQAILNETFSKADYLDDMFGTNATEDVKTFKKALEGALENDEEYVQLQAELDVAEIDLSESRKQLSQLKKEAEELNIDLSKAVYGNIDTNNRQKLEWTDENLNQYKDQLLSWFGNNMSWDDIIAEMGDFSTVFGAWDTFGEQKIPVAFSPILQTENGPQLLDQNTVHDYVAQIMTKATEDGSWTIEEVIQLDAKGIGNIKGLIADVGDTAEQTAQAMHFTGSTGAVANLTSHINILESTVDTLLSKVATKIQGVLDKYPVIKSALAAVGIDTNDLAGYFSQTGEYANQAAETILTTITTVDTLTASVEAYQNALDAVNNITSDGQAISEDYYNTLKEQLADVTVGTESFSDAIDTSNGYVVKNAALLKKLVNQSKQAKKATIEVAKSQAQLQYRQLVAQIRNSVMAMGVEYQAHNLITEATFNNIEMMREQIDALKQTIQQYALLEISLSKAASAYTEYEKAKERDSQLTYDESFLEMLKTIDEGLLKNETGTEAFEYAVKALVPEQFWKDIDDVDKKVRSIHDYIDGDPVFSKLFYVDEESGELDITADNVRAFIEMSKEAGLITGDATNFSLSDKVAGVKDFADALGITEAATLALLSATEKVDAKWGNILTDVTTKPLERGVNASVKSVDEATVALEDFWKKAAASGKFDSTEYQKLCQQLEEANKKLQENEQKANENAKNYTLCQSALSAYRGELKLSKEEADALARSLGFIDDNGNPTISINDDGTLNLTDEQVAQLLTKLGLLEEPAIMRVQLQYDNIVANINELQKYIDEGCKGTITIDGVNITNQEEAERKIAELTPAKNEIELTYKITETSSEQEGSVLESYQELAKNGLQFTVTADTTQAQGKLTAINENNPDDKSFKITADGSTAEQVIKSIADQLANIKDKDITITVTEKRSILETVISAFTGEKGPNGALGNAFASGSIGLKQAQHNTVVGELGQEMVVDPIRGMYYTVGDHGTEMIDLPKGAIIYNHKQTEELLKNGRTSRGKYTGGLAFARGNAASYGIPSYHPNLKDKTSFVNSTAINTKWDDAIRDLSDAADNISSAADSASDVFEEVFDWVEVRLEEIEEQLSLLNAQLKNAVGYIAKNQIIDVTLDVNNSKLSNLQAGLAEYERYAAALLTQVPSSYRAAAQNGAIAIEEFVGEADEKTLEAINNYREWAQKAADLKQQIEELKTEIADLAKQKFDNVANEYDNIISLTEAANDKLDAQISLMEDRGYVAAKEYYEAMAENTKDINAELVKERNTLQAVLDEQVKLGNIKVGSDAWYEMVQQLYDVDAAIVECTSDLESFQNAINDIYWDNFDELIKRYDYLSDETQNLIDLMDKADMVTKPDNENGWSADEVKWTDEGIASLGLYAQQMEIAEYKSKQYAKAIEDLNKDYKDGKYSESEYLEKLNELKDAQYDSIEAYYDAQDAIKDLNEARIDEVKNGIEKQIEAYEKLIEKQKEELDAEKDLHDFQKSIADQQKNISDIQRKLDALNNDHSISAAAKRKQLEAELAEAQYELEEMYYDRSVEDKQNALDKELESFQEEKEAEIQKWEEYLENVEQVVADSLNIVQANASGVYDTLNAKAEEYNLTLSEAIMTPWADGTLAISDYQTVFDTAASSTMDQLEKIKLKWQEVIDVMSEKAEVEIAAQEKANNRYVSATTSTKPTTSATTTKPATNTTTKSTPSVGQTVRVKSSATHFSSQSGNARMASFVPGGTYQVMQVGINGDKSQILIGKNGQYTGWVKLTDLEGYAKGTLGVPEDQFAWLDELGEELVMHADGNGRLSFMTKGSSVIPADITKNLMQLGQLNTQDLLDRSRPVISAPQITNNNIELTMDIAEVVHIDTVTNETIPNLTKAIDKQLDKYMKNLNNQVRKYSR